MKGTTGKKILETERCILREFTMDDMDALYRLYEHPDITRFVEPLYSREKEEEYERKYIRCVYGKQGFGMWLVEDRDSGEVIGRAGLEHHLTDPDDTVELGYIVDIRRQRQGIATEVCRALLQYAKIILKKTQIYARVHPENEVSNHLMEKLSFYPTEEILDGERVWRKGL